MQNKTDNKTATDAPEAPIDQQLGCNVRGRIEYIIALTVQCKPQEAIMEGQKLLRFFPRHYKYSYSEKEKLAASIIDKLAPVWINETGAYIAPSTFKALTVRLTELL